MSFTVVKPGLLTLLEDFGRYGQQGRGYTQGGPMDEHAFLWANKLLGNHFNAPQLEITLGQLTLQANAATQIALTGADLKATINGQAIAPWSSYYLKQGDELKFQFAASGVRAYLAVSGGFQVKNSKGSCATVVREKIGGLDGQGRQLQAGDELYFPLSQAQPLRSVPFKFRPNYQAPLRLRVLAGYQVADFSRLELERFYQSEYQLTTQCDRMGYRLQGAKITSQRDGVISEGISFGAIQIPADGQPIILMKDRQTIGGYPKLGTVVAADLSQLAQRPANFKVQFCQADRKQVQQERLDFLQFFGCDG